MKYYSEEETRDLRLAFEEQVLSWSHVTAKRMFGCPCYQAEGKLFAFLVTGALVITRLKQVDREELSREHQTSFFETGRKKVQSWVKISIESKDDLASIMPFVRKSYECALQRT